MSGFRFTAWFSREELDMIEERAREAGTSKNFIVRMAVRSVLLDKPMPSYLRREELQK